MSPRPPGGIPIRDGKAPGEHGNPGRQGRPGPDPGHMGRDHEPSAGVLAGEAARSVNHAAHGLQGLGQAAREAEALGMAAREAGAVHLAVGASNVVVTTEAAEEGARAARAARAAKLERASGLAADATRMAAFAGASEATSHGGHGWRFKGFAGVGVLGGVLQVGMGLHGLHRGKRGEGARNLLAGAGYAGSGIAELALAPRVAGRLAPPLAGAAAMIEGVHDIARSIAHPSPRHMAVGAAKAGGGAMLAASPFAAGAVLGLPAGVLLAVLGTGFVAGAVLYENAGTLVGWARSLGRRLG